MAINEQLPSVAATKIMKDVCCECLPNDSRCSTKLCPCLSSGSLCERRCETARYRCDCLNQAIGRCRCDPTATDLDKLCCGGHKLTTGRTGGCECRLINEACTKLCLCKRACKNVEIQKQEGIMVKKKPPSACGCTDTKKGCTNGECTCRKGYGFCTSNCACQAVCKNASSSFAVTKNTKQCFMGQKNETTAAIVTLLGGGWVNRIEFHHESKSDLHPEEQLFTALMELISEYQVNLEEVVLYCSKSPCYHQDCNPLCEVIDDCNCNKACAKLLVLLLYKVRKELKTVDVNLTVRFLYPHLARGDLYTKQAIMYMLQHGINVEPLLMSDWSAIVEWGPSLESPCNYLDLWNEHQLDQAVARGQSIVNECRRSLSLPLKFWVAEIHEIVKKAVSHYVQIRSEMSELNSALQCLDLTATPRRARSSSCKRRSLIDILDIRERLRLKEKSSGSLTPNTETQQLLTSLCGKSFDDLETNEIANKIRRVTANITLEIDSLLDYLRTKGGNHSCSSTN
ncbi:unnamed protein product [Soboliphyme baturini]|uniref:APOBEC_N domain-containing protein n=1 Tax=Soboliphyme baturini TaxID=241478 RepID=A0A183IMD0_9BILA|nr:unnamed protein product [Soboliphyme baturini]